MPDESGVFLRGPLTPTRGPSRATRRSQGTAAGGPVLSSVARVAWVRAPELRGCLPAAGLAFVCLYSSVALSGFVLQQLLFQVLVPARTRGGAADECWRQWAMRNVVPIPYWRRQRDQIVRIAQSK